MTSLTHFKNFDSQRDVARFVGQLFAVARHAAHAVSWRQQQQKRDVIGHVNHLKVVQPMTDSTLRAETYKYKYKLQLNT